jgi:hypothetical protein
MSDVNGDIDTSQHGSGQHQRTDIDMGGVPQWANAVLAGAAIAIAIGSILVYEFRIDSKVAAAKAEARAEFADALAKAQADMHLAETNALLAKDRTDKMAASLEARGLIKLENH